MKTRKFKIRFEGMETFENVFEILPSIYWYRQHSPFRLSKYGKGIIIFAWLKWGVIVYKLNENHK